MSLTSVNVLKCRERRKTGGSLIKWFLRGMVKKLELSDLTLGIMMTSTPLLSIPFQCALIEL